MRYLLFAITQYNASGGWDDLLGAVNSVEEAEDLLKKSHRALDYAHLVDLHTMQITQRWINSSFYPDPPHWIKQ